MTYGAVYPSTITQIECYQNVDSPKSCSSEFLFGPEAACGRIHNSRLVKAPNLNRTTECDMGNLGRKALIKTSNTFTKLDASVSKWHKSETN